MTSDDLDRPFRTLFQNISLCVFGAHHENLNEDRPILSAAKMYSAMTVVAGNIKCMRIFAAVPWRRGVKRQCGNCNRKLGFSGLWDATSSAP